MALTHQLHPAIAAECGSFGAPVSIELTEAAAAAFIRAYEDHRAWAEGDLCCLCAADVMYVAITLDTAPSTDIDYLKDGQHGCSVGCDDPTGGASCPTDWV